MPVLVGTNILNVMMCRVSDNYGPTFLQKAKLTTPLYLAFKCMMLRDRELEKRNNRLAIVRYAGDAPITIRPNSEVTMDGITGKNLAYPPVCTLLQPTANSRIPSDLDITPSVVPYHYERNYTVKVHVTNLSTATATIQPIAILCEIQPVTVEDISTEVPLDPATAVLDKVEVCTDDLSDDEISQGRQLLEQHRGIFSVRDTDLGHTFLVKHRIELSNDISFKRRCRRIPPFMFEEVRNHLHQLLAAGVIHRSHSPWSSNIVLVRKKNGKLRLCVDYRQLNERTVKDAYSLPRIDEILDWFAGNRFFSVVDISSSIRSVMRLLWVPWAFMSILGCLLDLRMLQGPTRG